MTDQTQMTYFLNRPREFLEPNERPFGLQQLHPAEKRDAYLLTAAILDRQIPYPTWDADHIFGFSACRTPSEQQKLGGLYHAILTQGRTNSNSNSKDV